MDDLLIHCSRQSHMSHMEDFLQDLLKNTWKFPPKKCLLFRIELQYMGNTVFIKKKMVYVKPLRSTLEAI